LGSNEEIKEWFIKKYEISFHLFAKVKVVGDGVHDLF
jgi:glutathione peroxidase-family protein